MRWLCTLLCLSAFCGVLAVAAPAHAQFNNMAAAVPDDANVLMLLSVDRILKSEIGIKQDWATKFANAYDAGLTHIPTDATRVLVATQLDLDYLKPVWELAVMELNRDASMPYIAQQTKGRVDKVGNVPAVILPNDTFILQLTPARLAAYSPANRQVVGRWLEDIRARRSVGVSPYLQNALEIAAKGQADIVQAMDLEYALPGDVIRKRLEGAEALKGKKVDLDKLASLLTGIKGIMLSVNIEADVQGELVIDFGDDTSLLAEIGKPLLLEVLTNRGSTIEDFEQWQVKVQGTQLLLSGPLTAAGLRKVLSLIEQPAPSISVAPPAVEANPKTPPPTEESLKATASQQYFRAIRSILRDASSEYRSAQTIPQGALWLERFARRIDNLPLLNVDPDLLGYGQWTANMLRSMASAIRSTGAETSALTAQIVQQSEAYGSFGFDPGSWGSGRYGWGQGWVQWNDVQGERTAVRADQRNKQAQAVIKGREQIANATQQVRAKMTERYKIEF